MVKMLSVEILSLKVSTSIMNSLLRSFTSFATQTRPSTLIRAAPFGFIQPALVRGFKVRTSVKKFCDQCYVSDPINC